MKPATMKSSIGDVERVASLVSVSKVCGSGTRFAMSQTTRPTMRLMMPANKVVPGRPRDLTRNRPVAKTQRHTIGKVSSRAMTRTDSERGG